MDLVSLFKRKKLNGFIVCLFCFAIIFGPAFALFDSYDYNFDANPDIETYLGLANFEFDQNPVRKYRIIIPFLAAAINQIFGGLFEYIAPNTFPGPDFSLGFSFLLINCLFMSLFGMMIYRFCRIHGVSQLAAIIGLICVLTCRWTSYAAGIPMVDSLFLCVAAAVLLALKTNNSKLIILTIFIGPWAKESFIFFVPLILLYSDIPKIKQLGLFTLSGILVFTFRYYFDGISNETTGLGMKNGVDHFSNVPDAFRRLFSFHGLYEIVSIVGLWGVLFLGLLNKGIRRIVQNEFNLMFVLYFLIVFIHALLSVQLSRMFYMATPIIALILALISDQLLKSRSNNSKTSF